MQVLVIYFGDKTFQWQSKDQLMPFKQHKKDKIGVCREKRVSAPNTLLCCCVFAPILLFIITNNSVLCKERPPYFFEEKIANLEGQSAGSGAVHLNQNVKLLFTQAQCSSINQNLKL